MNGQTGAHSGATGVQWTNVAEGLRPAQSPKKMKIQNQMQAESTTSKNRHETRMIHQTINGSAFIIRLFVNDEWHVGEQSAGLMDHVASRLPFKGNQNGNFFPGVYLFKA